MITDVQARFPDPNSLLMASIIPGYEFDIFISYRQKDNRYDGWVTEFVSNLRHELEATLRDEINVYFDLNPYDGILETHDVSDSLKGKLNSLIFIPVISRTYCDPKSFAWKYEFKAFIEEASKDRLGLKVKLRNGNVASRVLPVRIYDLEDNDVGLCEDLTGGTLRGIDFIYRSAGVNRPLRAGEDHPGDNAGKIYYRDQINKVANSVREILDALTVDQEKKKVNEMSNQVYSLRKSKKFQTLTILLIFLAFILAGFFLSSKIFKHADAENEKSIAVLPFVNMSKDKEQDYLGDGMTEEILNNLFMIGGLNIPSYTSSMRYEGSDLSIKDIARQLKVAYLLEGSVSKVNNKLRISVRLVDGKTGLVRWREEYWREVDVADYLEIQSDIARNVVKSLKIALNSSIEDRITFLPTKSTEAYELYLKAMNLYGEINMMAKFRLLEKAISLDPEYADALAGLANWWLDQGGHGGMLTREDVLEKAEPLLSKALKLDPNSVMAHFATARLSLYYYHDFRTVEKEYEIVRKLAPSNSVLIAAFSDYLHASGRFEEALDVQQIAFEHNPENAYRYMSMAVTSYFNGHEDRSSAFLDSALFLNPQEGFLVLNSIRLYIYMGRYKDAINLFDMQPVNDNEYYNIPFFRGLLGVAWFMTGNNARAERSLKELVEKSRMTSIGSPSYFAAAIYTAMGQNDKALSMLEKAYDDREVEIYWLKVEPLFSQLHGDVRFEKLIDRIDYN